MRAAAEPAPHGSRGKRAALCFYSGGKHAIDRADEKRGPVLRPSQGDEEERRRPHLADGGCCAAEVARHVDKTVPRVSREPDAFLAGIVDEAGPSRDRDEARVGGGDGERDGAVV